MARYAVNATCAIYFCIAASLVFLWDAGDVSLYVALGSMAINMAFAYRLRDGQRRRITFFAAIACNLAILGYLKYSQFLIGSLAPDLKSLAWKRALPLGISFYTFQQIAFLADLYRKKISGFTFKKYNLFIFFFPQFIAGPIVHYNYVQRQFSNFPRANLRSVKFGLFLLLLGMGKKLLGDQFGSYSTLWFAEQGALGLINAWLAMLCFTFQIYFDFSGYSDMALGLARLFGIALPVNFISPYKARSLRDFWRRWHITLSEWLRDYLYISLGGSRHGVSRTMAALLITMVLGGLWHGAGWTFILWGFAHGLGLVFVHFIRLPLPLFLRRSATFLFVALCWVLFRSETIGGAAMHYLALVDISNIGLSPELARSLYLSALAPFIDLQQLTISDISQLKAFWLCAAGGVICFLLPNSQNISLFAVARKVRHHAFPLMAFCVITILALMLLFIQKDSTNEFIYFQF